MKCDKQPLGSNDCGLYVINFALRLMHPGVPYGVTRQTLLRDLNKRSAGWARLYQERASMAARLTAALAKEEALRLGKENPEEDVRREVAAAAAKAKADKLAIRETKIRRGHRVSESSYNSTSASASAQPAGPPATQESLERRYRFAIARSRARLARKTSRKRTTRK